MDPANIADNVLRSVESGEDVKIKESWVVHGKMLLVSNLDKKGTLFAS